MKRFTVMSRNNAKEYSKYELDEPTIIISITDKNSDDNEFFKNKNIIDICRVKFDDVEIDDEDCISKEDAKTILDFMKKYENDIYNIIVHCEAGISRSAGVCAALMLIYNGSDKEIFHNARYCPNMTAYRTILNTYYDISDKSPFLTEEEIKEKENGSIKLWRDTHQDDILDVQ